MARSSGIGVLARRAEFGHAPTIHSIDLASDKSRLVRGQPVNQVGDFLGFFGSCNRVVFADVGAKEIRVGPGYFLVVCRFPGINEALTTDKISGNAIDN
jgi:hypothetical protein